MRFLEGGGAGREQAAEAHPHERDPLRIDPRQLQGEVDHRRDDLLPVGTEGEALAMQRPELPRTVKGERVQAALGRRARAAEMHLFRRAVNPLCMMTVVRVQGEVGAMEV